MYIKKSFLFLFLFSNLGFLAVAGPSKHRKVRFLLQNQWVEGKDWKKEKQALFLPGSFHPSFWQLLERRAYGVLKENQQLLGLSESTSFRLASKVRNSDMESLRFKRYQVLDMGAGNIEEMEIKGGDILVHFQNGNLSYANSNWTRKIALPENSFSKEEALARARAFHARKAELLGEVKPILLLLPSQKEYLSYEVQLLDREDISKSASYYIDASDGSLIYSASMAQNIKEHSHAPSRSSDFFARTRIVMGGFYGDERDQTRIDKLFYRRDELQAEDVFPIIYTDFSCRNNLQTNPVFSYPAKTPKPCQDLVDHVSLERRNLVEESASKAWKNAGIFYDFFREQFLHHSFDNRNTPMRILVQFRKNYSNAFWLPALGLVAFGGGDSQLTNDMAQSLEVSSHELVHGMISSTSQLEYSGESGALNESYADIFGKIISIQETGLYDWKFGRDIFLNPIGEGKGLSYIRDMKYPIVSHSSQQLFQGELCSDRNDFCGVHSNSGVFNRAAVLIGERIGLSKLSRIYYLTLTQLLQTFANFKEARRKTIIACEHLFGTNAEECSVVAESFSEVGIL